MIEVTRVGPFDERDEVAGGLDLAGHRHDHIPVLTRLRPGVGSTTHRRPCCSAEPCLVVVQVADADAQVAAADFLLLSWQDLL